MDLKQVIPKRFYNASQEPHPTASTVGELADLLGELPPDLPIGYCEDDVAQVVVYNIDEKFGRAHLGVEIANENYFCSD